MPVARRQLTDVLRADFDVSREDIRRGLETARKNDTRLGRALVALGVVGDLDLARALSAQLGLPVMESIPVDD
ncbi:MAG: secretion system protein E, partial [Myxococcota bacterium]|nr:secretion system protein E [Myxococcota bacterium]